MTKPIRLMPARMPPSVKAVFTLSQCLMNEVTRLMTMPNGGTSISIADPIPSSQFRTPSNSVYSHAVNAVMAVMAMAIQPTMGMLPMATPIPLHAAVATPRSHGKNPPADLVAKARFFIPVIHQPMPPLIPLNTPDTNGYICEMGTIMLPISAIQAVAPPVASNSFTFRSSMVSFILAILPAVVSAAVSAPW